MSEYIDCKDCFYKVVCDRGICLYDLDYDDREYGEETC